MNHRCRVSIATLSLTGIVLLVSTACPSIDLLVSGLFYTPGKGFTLARDPFWLGLHEIAYYGARILTAYLILAMTVAFLRHGPFLRIEAKGWAFLLFGLLIGPGLIANAGLKDHWARARPREVTEFGGTATFSPALVPQTDGHRNGSFVSGDGAFGFYLPSFAYVVPRRRATTFLLAGSGLGALFGAARIFMGAHFLSDVMCAGLFMFAIAAALHAAMYGRRTTAGLWREWLGFSAKDPDSKPTGR